MNLLQLIRSFTRTAEAGSMAGGARALGISAAAVGQNIARLEAHLGVRLFNRTPRSLALSEAGARYLQQVRHIEGDLLRAQAAAGGEDAEPAGPLRVACSRAFGRHVLAPLLPALVQRHPRLQVELCLSDRAVHHGDEAIDASIRIDEQLQPGLVARPLALVPFLFCAAPAWLARAGTPRTPEQLAASAGVLYRFPTDGRLLRWGLTGPQGRLDVTARPAMICDDIDAVAELTAAGAGITRLASFVAEPYLRDGRLQAVLHDDPDWQAEPMRLSFCVSDRRDFTVRIRALFDHLRGALPAAWQV